MPIGLNEKYGLTIQKNEIAHKKKKRKKEAIKWTLQFGWFEEDEVETIEPHEIE